MKRGFVLLVSLLVFWAFFYCNGFTETKKKDINTATVEELIMVKGVGNKKAELIVEYIKNKGRINDMDELLDVKGIGMHTLHNIKELFEVNPFKEEVTAKDNADSSH